MPPERKSAPMVKGGMSAVFSLWGKIAKPTCVKGPVYQALKPHVGRGKWFLTDLARILGLTRQEISIGNHKFRNKVDVRF